jgi:hypothetical protein
MSVFSGKVGKGAMRARILAKRQQAYQRQLAIWNDGTGYITTKRRGYKRVGNPLYMLGKCTFQDGKLQFVSDIEKAEKYDGIQA